MSVHGRVEARDRGLDRVSRLTSWTLAGGLVLSGGFAAVAAHAFAGQRSARRPTGSVAGLGASAPMTSNTVPGTSPAAPLGTPQTVPQTAPQTVPQTVPQYNYNYQLPPVVSGGS